MKQRKKLYLVKREVVATSVREALRARGTVYEVCITKEEEWPTEKVKVNGFGAKPKKDHVAS